MRRYRVPGRRDWIDALVRVAAYVVAMTVAFIIYWPAGAVVTVAGLIALIAWHHKAVAYRCQHCGETFEISFVVDLVSPHGIGRGDDREARAWKYLRCPHCRKRSRATAVVIADDR
jgi:DNA-directed RNA polymerase subunit RPC12/RpoP